ncbi:Radial spoke head protein 9-like [Acipenser ruthenus]|uniref:Radial spoke head protein 9 homolog n=1 Tax=Acipenser ruthenus TaxID=7906 RepID=A0A444TVT1_ACIRT|nr:Radial spoke head protein 9-like [Acipenser ruthenus]
MDFRSLHFSLDLVAGSGLVLSPEQKATLQTSLVILKRHYKFTRVVFWGKILGIKADYYIAQGIGHDEISDKKTLYSLNCMEWNLLPPATKTMIDETSVIKGCFLGDPSHDYEHIETRKDEDGHEAQEEEITVKIKEEQRLAAAISLIDKEAAVVPRGAYIKTPHGLVHTNRSFEGSWSLQFEKCSSVLVLRSLLWCGLTFYHIPMTPQHGYIYMGTGLKNIDLPFML